MAHERKEEKANQDKLLSNDVREFSRLLKDFFNDEKRADEYKSIKSDYIDFLNGKLDKEGKANLKKKISLILIALLKKNSLVEKNKTKTQVILLNKILSDLSSFNQSRTSYAAIFISPDSSQIITNEDLESKRLIFQSNFSKLLNLFNPEKDMKSILSVPIIVDENNKSTRYKLHS